MDARQLTYFLGIVDHGSYSRAAEELHIAQPSLSQSIKQLEKDLGVKLFRRAGRGVVLSEPGRALVGPARQVVRSLRGAREAVVSTLALEVGRIELSAMPSPAVEPLTTLAAELRRRHPGLSLSVESALTVDDVVQAVRAGSVELGLLGTAHDVATAELDHVLLQRQAMVLISPPSNAPTRELVTREELQGLDFVISPRGNLMRQVVDEALGARIHDRVVAEVSHRSALLPMVLAGLGHTVMPESWRRTAESLGCVVRPIESAPVLNIELVYQREALSPAGWALVDVARQFAADHRSLPIA